MPYKTMIYKLFVISTGLVSYGAIIFIILDYFLIMYVYFNEISDPSIENAIILIPLISYIVAVANWMTLLLHLAFTKDVPRNRKAFWLIIFIIGNILITPFYWYWYVKKPNIALKGTAINAVP